YASKRTGKTNKSIVSDGAHLWVIDQDNKEVVVKDLRADPLPAAATFLTGKGKLHRQFSAALDVSGTYGGAGATVVLLVPKRRTAAYAKLYLVVDASGAVSQTVVVDAAGNTSVFAFGDVDTATAIDDRLFAVDTSVQKLRHYRIVTP